jgi:DNA-binding transcriptional regulator YdaS (Cro superfamily)
MKVIKINSLILNKSEIARRLDVSPAYVSMIMSGKRKALKIRSRIIEIITSELMAA